MESAGKELEEQLVEAGNKLLQPPDSVDELLSLLDQVEDILSRVDQSPSKAMQTALSPSLKALVADDLLRHPDIDVKVAVATCISEITRITAPDAPYDDDKMKDVFQLIVSSFEDLSDNSSRTYNKRTLILETVAKVRSCVIMLDLECDGLIVEMFQHFLKAISNHHSDNVFSSMETIMALVLEESEDISPELISTLLSALRRDRQEVLPIARKLAEKVFEKCATKLKPYLLEEKKSLRLSLDDYSEVVASICEEPTDASAERMEEASKEIVEVPCSVGNHPAMEESSKSISNGDLESGNEDRLESDSSKKLEHAHQADRSVEANIASNAEPDGGVAKSESKVEPTSKKRGRKPKSILTSTEPSDSTQLNIDKKVEEAADHLKTDNKEVHGSRSEDQLVEEALSLEDEKEAEMKSLPKALESKPANVSSSSRSGNASDEGSPKIGECPKKNDTLSQAVIPTSDAISEKISDETRNLEEKPQRQARKKTTPGTAAEEKASALEETSKSEGGATSDSATKPLKKLVQKLHLKKNIVDKSSSKKEDGKKHEGGKVTSKKDVTKSTVEDDKEEVVSSPKSPPKLAEDEMHVEETSKATSKRKRRLGQEKASGTMEYGDNLVGSKVKVWWPKDRAFYEGIIDSFDSVKKRHKVSYTDGDEEILYLKKERWEFIESFEGDSMSDREQAIECRSPDSSSEMHKKKKAKAISEPSAQQAMRKHSRGEAVSGKLTGSDKKSGRKSQDDNKMEGKSKDRASKSGGISEDDSGGKSKSRSRKSSGKSGRASKVAGRSENVEGDTPKTGTKSRQDTLKAFMKGTQKTSAKESSENATPKSPKIASKSKGKTSKSGSKSSNGSGKMKRGSVRKETGREKSPEKMEIPETGKGKLADAWKGQESGVKSGKKRRREAKS
ncbi:sister chromatid cohesion protein PDS5 homolog C isoform X2 [Diospyros lotus]|uniref:sister chromatid cohesion protein PDS5 homolog C isoform X2 n=1 Tax=Diospyros lotus TaxID=55363 RepID=UPI0022575952|nr:sister chromatid cohesion protein PDS5 homolog C isoform X2 [Diospyros lotus]